VAEEVLHQLANPGRVASSARGYLSRQIAERLVLTLKTVSNHIQNIYMKIAAEMASNGRAAIRLTLRRSYEYLYRHGTIAGRLCRSGMRAEVISARTARSG
jgi:hypothetical protein